MHCSVDSSVYESTVCSTCCRLQHGEGTGRSNDWVARYLQGVRSGGISDLFFYVFGLGGWARPWPDATMFAF